MPDMIQCSEEEAGRQDARLNVAYKAAMARLLQAGYIEPTIPDKPNSRLQQYRLTDKGRSALK